MTIISYLIYMPTTSYQLIIIISYSILPFSLITMPTSKCPYILGRRNNANTSLFLRVRLNNKLILLSFSLHPIVYSTKCLLLTKPHHFIHLWHLDDQSKCKIISFRYKSYHLDCFSHSDNYERCKLYKATHFLATKQIHLTRISLLLSYNILTTCEISSTVIYKIYIVSLH